LRRYVDQGGTLWVDITDGGSLEPTQNLPITVKTESIPGALVASLNHPLLSFPNQLDLGDVLNLSAQGDTAITNLTNGDVGALSTIFNSSLAETFRLEPVAGPATGGTVNVARIGDGFLVVTTRFAASTLNQGFNPSAPGLPNIAFNAQATVQNNTFTSGAKFVVNLLSLSSSYSGVGGGSRKTNSTRATVGAPAINRFVVDAANANGPSNGFTSLNAPALFKGRMVTTSGNRIFVYSSRPGAALDGTGSSDNGVQDPVGAGYDLIWASAPASGTLSAPTVVEAPDSTVRDQIWVTTSQGEVLVFNLEAAGANVGPVRTHAAGASLPPAGPIDGPYAVTVHEGLAFATDARSVDQFGRIRTFDLRTMDPVQNGSGNAFAVFASPRMPRPSGSPTVGYIPIRDASGGMDRVAYLPTRPIELQGRTAGVTSLWIGAKGESPFAVSQTGTQVTLNLRPSLNQLPILMAPATGLAPRITLLRENGDPFTTSEMQAVLTGVIQQPVGAPGTLQVFLQASAVGAFNWDGSNPAQPRVGWRVDYTLDWGTVTGGTTPGDSFVRGNIEVPDNPSAIRRRIIGSPALAPSGNLLFAVSDPTGTASGGTFFNIIEEGRGDFLVRTRYDLYNAITGFQTVGGGTVAYREPVLDEDELLRAIPILRGTLRDFRFASSVAIKGDVAYVTANAIKQTTAGFPAPSSVLLAFRVAPDPLELTVDIGAPTGQELVLTLAQPDVARSANPATPTAFSALANNAFTVNRIPASNLARIIIPSLSPARRGAMTSCISTNLPLLVRRANQADVLIEPEATGSVTAGGATFTPGFANGKFNHNLWYAVLNGYTATAGPIVTGETMFVAGNSVLPSLTTSGFSAIREDGLLFGFASTVAGNDPFLQSNSLRPWLSQLMTLRKTGATPFDFSDVSPSTSVLWPQPRGIESFDDFRIRLLQAALTSTVAGEDTRALTLAAGDGVIATTTPRKLHAFARSDFWVVDAGRISRFDPSGNPIFSTDKVLLSGEELARANAGQVRGLNSPTRVYPDGVNGAWVVDTGANAVMRLDGSARAIRTISRLRFHPTFRPAGMLDNAPADLRSPRDVLTFTTFRSVAEVASTFPGETLRQTATAERWEHVVIADAGNNRVVELIDRYRLDSSGRVLGIVEYQDRREGAATGNFVPALGVALWHTPEELSGKGYSYNTLSRTRLQVGPTIREIYAFGFGNVEPGRATFGLDTVGGQRDVSSGFGGVVLYDGPNSTVINSFQLPGVPQNSFLGENPVGSGNFQFNLPVNNQSVRTVKISGLNSVTLRYVSVGGTPTLAVMIAMSSGIYELVEDTTETNPEWRWKVRWMLPREAFVGMRRPRTGVSFTVGQLQGNPQDFRPMYARRLDSGDVLVVNGFSGRRFGGTQNLYDGEVLLIDGIFGDSSGARGYLLGRANLGFDSLSVKFELPPVVGIRGIVNPVFAERQ
nr:hypothetical protein [Fimbriimonadaceae bacterium]